MLSPRGWGGVVSASTRIRSKHVRVATRICHLSVERLETRDLLNAGTLDATFGAGGLVTTDVAAGIDRANSVAIQDDGKIVVAGVAQVGGGNDFAVVRYNADGSLDDGSAADTTPGDQFGANGIVTIDFGGNDDEATGVVIDAAGGIIVAGFSIAGGSGDFALARLDTVGNLDAGFGTAGLVITDFGADDRANGIALQRDGKLVLAGFTATAVGTDFALARYNTNGSLDPNFDADGRVTTDFVASSVAFSSSNATALADGETTISTIPVNDTVFIADLNVNLNITHPNADELDIVLRHVPSNTAITLVNDVASGGSNFQGTNFDDEAAAGINDPSNSAPYLGSFRPVQPLDAFDGLDAQGDWQLELRDDTANAVTGVLNQWTLLIAPATIDQGNAIAIQSDGRIVVAGTTNSGGDNDFAIVRYNVDGSLDLSFDTDGRAVTDFGGDDRANAVDIYPLGGNIAVAGVSDVGGGGNNFALASYETDGTLNDEFSVDGRTTTDIGSGNDQAFALVILANGKLVAAGTTDSTGSNSFALAAYGVNGALDSNFGANGVTLTDFTAGDDQVRGLALQANAKIVAAGFAAADMALARFDGEAADIVVTGADEGTRPIVHVYDAREFAEIGNFLAYPAAFRGGVRVAAGDINGDGLSDVITAPGPGMAPTVQVFDGNVGQVLDFLAYDEKFRGGVFVATGDVNGDGTLEIITGPDSGMEPRVRVFDGQTGALIREFLAFNGRFRKGVRVAAGDVNGDGADDVIVGAGPNAAPEVRVFDGATGVQFAGRSGRFIAFNPRFRGGVFVAAGDVNGDGRVDILTGAGRVAPRVKVFSGLDRSVIVDFVAFGATFRGGVRVASTDGNADGFSDIIVGSGPGQGPLVKVFDFVPNSLTPAEVDAYFADELDFNHGVFVGATRRR
jgi:uncharacterized delta-60 repeat protein